MRRNVKLYGFKISCYFTIDAPGDVHGETLNSKPASTTNSLLTSTGHGENFDRLVNVPERAGSRSSGVSSRRFEKRRAWASRATFGSGRSCCEWEIENCRALLLPRIVLWTHVNDIVGAYTVNLDDGFFASPAEVLGLGLDDCEGAGVNALVFSVSSLSPVPKFKVPDITVTCSVTGCQWAGSL